MTQQRRRYTDDEVKSILELHDSGMSQAKIAKQFGMPESSVSNIVGRRREATERRMNTKPRVIVTTAVAAAEAEPMIPITERKRKPPNPAPMKTKTNTDDVANALRARAERMMNLANELDEFSSEL